MAEITIEELMEMPPFSLDVPEHPVARIKAFVRVLAYGYISGFWPGRFQVIEDENRDRLWIPASAQREASPLEHYLDTKWKGKQPTVLLLHSMRFADQRDVPGLGNVQILTEKAYDLLELAPAAPIFISYRNQESSAIALLVLARMKAAGLSPFLDVVGLDPGDAWRERLREEIIRSKYMICLVGPSTLGSEDVCEEIRLAEKHGLRIIAVLHNTFSVEDLEDEMSHEAKLLKASQMIPVNAESTHAYNAAIVEVLNYFGVTP